MNHKKLKSFKINKKIGLVNYKLKLPDTIRIYPIFHISLLEPAPEKALNTSYTEAKLLEPDTVYNIEKILDCKYIRNKIYYLIK